jgi:HAD superfamily hydrolase (TIGR01459 family)
MTGEPSPLGVTRLVTGLCEIASAYDAIFCDVWGVVHDGRSAFPEACEALERFRRGGGTVLLLTNSPRPRQSVLHQLAKLGAPRSSFDDVVTSGDVTLSFMAERGDSPVHHIGPERDLALFEALRRETGLRPSRVDLADAAYVLCTGLNNDELETPDDYASELATMRARSLDFVCANPDLVVHVGDRLVFCAGALAARYEEMGGRVLQAGKPHPPIYARAFREVEKARGGAVDARRVLAIGDAMRTDIRGANLAGVDSLLVTTGIHREILHPQGAASLDSSAAFEQFVEGSGCRPLAAISRLRWRNDQASERT